MESLSSEDVVEINKKVGEKGTVMNHANLEFTLQKADREKKTLQESCNTAARDNNEAYIPGREQKDGVRQRNNPDRGEWEESNNNG